MSLNPGEGPKETPPDGSPVSAVRIEAYFLSASAAMEFASHVARHIFKIADFGVAALPSARGYLSCLEVDRELAPGTSTKILGTILLDERFKVAGLRFTAHTEGCDSGHEACWIEDVHGKTVRFSINPR